MSKVLVDRELLAGVCSMGPAKMKAARKELRAILAQPAEAEGSVEMGSDAWMALHLLDRLDVSADEEPRVQQVEEIVRRMGAALSAVTAERDRVLAEAHGQMVEAFAERDEVIAERDMVAGELSESRVDVSYYAARNEQLRAKVEALRPIHAMILNALDRDAEEGKAARAEMAAELRAAMAAKEA